MRLAREGAWVAFGQVFTILGRLVGIRIVTGLVAPSVYGEASLLLGVSALGMNVLCLPFLQAALRFYPDARLRGLLGGFCRAARSNVWRGAALAMAILVAGGSVWSATRGKADDLWGFLAAALLLVADVRRNLESVFLNAERRQAAAALWSALDSWLRFGSAGLAVLVFGSLSWAVLGGYAIGAGLANAVFRRWWLRRPDSSDAAAAVAWLDGARRDMLRFAAPLAPMALLAWVSGLADRYFIGGIKGLGVAGVYAAAAALASQPFLMLSGLAGTTLRPVLFDAEAAGNRRRVRKIVGLWAAIVGGIGAIGLSLLALLAEWIVRLALGPDYREAAGLLVWIGGGYGFLALQNLFETILYARRRTGWFLVLHSFAAAASIAGYATLIPLRGARGAAQAVCLAYAFSLALSAILAWRASRPA